MGTAIEHPVPDRVKPLFVIFDIWKLMLIPERQSAWMSKIVTFGKQIMPRTRSWPAGPYGTFLRFEIEIEMCEKYSLTDIHEIWRQ